MSELRKPVWRRIRKHRPKRRLTLAVLPTMLTLGNGTCGLAAIAVAVSDTLLWPEEQKLQVAGILIFVGMLFDAFDGHAARITNQASEFGAQLDSLCDAITFGTAPAVIVWRYSEVLPHRVAWTVGVLFTLCVLLRLARFNVETKEDDPHDRFDGLPSPAAAGTIASFAIAVPHLASLQTGGYSDWIQSAATWGVQASHYILPTLAVLLAYLMVSRFHYPHVFQQFLGGRRSPHQIGQAVFACVGLFVLHELVLPLGFCYFAFAPPLRQLLGGNGNVAPRDDSDEESADNGTSASGVHRLNTEVASQTHRHRQTTSEQPNLNAKTSPQAPPGSTSHPGDISGNPRGK